MNEGTVAGYAHPTVMCSCLPLLLLCLSQTFKTLLVGFPGGKICTEQHVPGYAQSVRQATQQPSSLEQVLKGISSQKHGLLACLYASRRSAFVISCSNCCTLRFSMVCHA
jgi:hypothetical protein